MQDLSSDVLWATALQWYDLRVSNSDSIEYNSLAQALRYHHPQLTTDQAIEFARKFTDAMSLAVERVIQQGNYSDRPAPARVVKRRDTQRSAESHRATALERVAAMFVKVQRSKGLMVNADVIARYLKRRFGSAETSEFYKAFSIKFLQEEENNVHVQDR